MRVHVFGNTPSPAVASYGLRKSVEEADPDVRSFVTDDFYVDDGLTSRPSTSDAISLLKRTQDTLQREGHIRLHKIASNCAEVMEAFPSDDLEKNLRTIDFNSHFLDLPTQPSLGLIWDLNKDMFVFRLNPDDKPAFRRGMLSIINSIFDPIGFLSPVVIGGRIMLREFGDATWDELLPESLQNKWNAWKGSLVSVEQFTIPRMFTATPLSKQTHFKIHIFSDASEKAIAAVGFLQVFSNSSSNPKVGFLMGKSRLAPSSGTTIPRLELCAAVLATNMAQTIMDQLYVTSEAFEFFTDSKVVLGYINNRTRRIYTYVSNPVQTILRLSHPSQWKYVSTKTNPADCGTRGDVSVSSLKQSMWIQGPDFLKDSTVDVENLGVSDVTIDEDIDNDPEVRPEIRVAKTQSKRSITRNFVNFSTWNSLVRATTFLRLVCKKVKKAKLSNLENEVEESRLSEQLIILRRQEDYFAGEVTALHEGKGVSPQSSIYSLNPILDERGIIRVGGRLRNSPVPFDQQHPILIPKGLHIAWLLAGHFHNKVHHQERLFTESAICTNGYWLVGVKRLVSSLIQCVVCRKLRGHFQSQLMRNLPADRVTIFYSGC